MFGTPVKIAVLALAVSQLGASLAWAQAPVVRFAAAPTCLSQAGTSCDALRRTYGIDVDKSFAALPSSDVGIEYLDAGLAEVAQAFTPNPQLVRRDIVVLRDDKRMFGKENVIPVFSVAGGRRLGAHRRSVVRRVNDVTSLLSTRWLRGATNGLTSGRVPEAMAGELVDAHYARAARRRPGAPVVVGYRMDVALSEVLAQVYALALGAGGYRASVKAVPNARSGMLAAARRHTITMFADISGALLSRLDPKADVTSAKQISLLRAALLRRGLAALSPAPGQDARLIVMKRDRAAALGVTKISDLGRYFPRAR